MEFRWSAPDGLVFNCERWEPAAPARGVLIGVHGLGGAATDFLALAEAVNAAGFAFFAINMRGQGSDPRSGRRGAELDLGRLETDFVAFGKEAAAAYAGLPIFWCGESMGAVLAGHLLATGRFPLPVRGVIFSVPVTELIKPTPGIVRAVLRVVVRFAPDLRLRPSLFVSGKAEQLSVTRDPDHSEKLRGMPHYVPAFTLGFLNNLGDLMESSPAIAAGVKIPALVLAAGQDIFIRVEQVRRWFDLLGSADKEFRFYPEAYHLLWNDFDRDLVLADILAWLERQMESASAG